MKQQVTERKIRSRMFGVMLTVAMMVTLFARMPMMVEAADAPVATIEPANSGTVQMSVNGGSVEYTAYPNDEFVFKEWQYVTSDGKSKTLKDNPTPKMSTRIQSIKAVFAEIPKKPFSTINQYDVYPSGTILLNDTGSQQVIYVRNNGLPQSIIVNDGEKYTTPCKLLVAYKQSPTGFWQIRLTDSIEFAVSSLHVYKGMTINNIGIGFCGYSYDFDKGKVTYESSNTNVATVDEQGIVTGVEVGSITLSAKIKNDPSIRATCTIEVREKEPATVTTAPTANILSYTGTEQELVTAGVASDGTMQYAIGENTTTAPTTGWSTSIPKGTDAKTYYVWYKAAGDETHKDSDAGYVEVKIKSLIQYTVTFKVVNGSWNDGTNENKTATLNGVEGDTLKLTADQIPAVGNKPGSAYKVGSWDTTPNTETAITSNTTYTYTYGDKAENPATVRDTASVMRGGKTIDLAENVTLNGATGAVSYSLSGDAGGCSLNGSILTSGADVHTVYVNVTVAEDDNYKALDAKRITVSVTDKSQQVIEAEDVSVTYGETDKKVTATVTTPSSGGGAISYTVKDGSGDYIDVDASTGLLTVKAVPADGKAYVTAKAAETDTYAEATKDVTITIAQAPVTPKVELNKTTLSLTVNEESTLTATTVPEGQQVTWTSSDAAIAAVDATGKVTAKAAGTAKVTATITVEGQEYKAECDVTVTAAPTPVTPKVELNKTALSLTVNEESTLTATTVPEGQQVTWTSSDAAIATVDTTGKVTAKAAGTAKVTATITVEGQEYKAECDVTVTAAPTPVTPKVELNKTALALTVNEESTLTATTVPEGQQVTWTSSDAAIATVDSTGKVTAKAAGTAKVTATITVEGQEYKAECDVTVTAPAPTPVPSETIVVPETLSDDSLSPEIIERYGSVEQVTVRLEESMGVTPESRGNSSVFDAQVVVIVDGQARPATPADITPEGLEAVFPYPDGTNKDNFIFSGAHMIGETAGGYQAGDIEGLSFTNADDGLHTRIHGLSPVIITWTAAAPGEAPQVDRHVHVYEWDTINATADQDGEMRYQCRICGDIQTRVPITAYYIFNKETTEKIRRAKQGETVKIETARWISFHKMVMEALADRPDVTLEVSFLDEGHKGTRKNFTIPAGTDTKSLVDDKGFAGFIFLTNKFGN